MSVLVLGWNPVRCNTRSRFSSKAIQDMMNIASDTLATPSIGANIREIRPSPTLPRHSDSSEWNKLLRSYELFHDRLRFLQYTEGINDNASI